MLTYKGIGYEIVQDNNPDSPREWDNLGTIVCFHRRYNLGDKTDLTPDMFGGWDELKDYLVKKLNAKVVLPLYMYDHGVQSVSTRSFFGRAQHAEWDSGQIGFIYVTAEQIRENFMVSRITKKTLENTQKVLEAEVSEYDQWMQGDVWGYKIPALDDSCWGFYGFEYCKQEVQNIIDNYLQ